MLTIERLSKVLEDPYGEYKENKDKIIIGYLPMYFPEEIVSASGAIPVGIIGKERKIELADQHLMTNACAMLRTSYEGLLKGDYDFLDGLATILICDQIRFFWEVWSLDKKFPLFCQMWLPYQLDGTTRGILIDELNRFKNELTQLTGNEMTEDDLRESIEIYNQFRSLLRKVNEKRINSDNFISFSEMVKIVCAGMVLPKEIIIEDIENIFTEGGISKNTTNVDKKRLILCGHLCAPPDLALLDLIENCGGKIVGDDLFFGERYFSQDVSVNGDPIENIADRFFERLPCTTIHYGQTWLEDGKKESVYGEYIVNLLRNRNADGVIVLREMYCDPLDMEYVLFKKKMDEAGVPSLSLMTDMTSAGTETARNQIQAFYESICQ